MNKPSICAINEDSYLIRLADKIDLNLTATISALNKNIKQCFGNDLLDCTPSYTTILVQFNLLKVAPLVVFKQLQVLLEQVQQESHSPPQKTHRLPVYYDASVAPDLQALADAKGLTVEQVIQIHSEQTYQICALGFSPGFAFLAEVDPRIQMPRLATPRGKVNAGSVAIADKQTAVYPSDSPGGWNIIGHCPIRLFDMAKQPISDFNVGDQVQFFAVDQAQYLALMEEQWGRFVDNSCASFTHSVPLQNTGIQVINPGVLCQIQDCGRFGQSEQGVSQGGVADSKSAGWANRLLSNDHDAPLLEVTVGGLTLLAEQDLQMAIVGADMSAKIIDRNNHQLAKVYQQSFLLRKGQTLQLNFAQHGVRAYIAVKGGFDVRKVLGSASTVSRNRLGGQSGDGQSIKQGEQLAVAKQSEAILSRYVIHRVPTQFVVRQKSVTRIGLIESYQVQMFTAQDKQTLYNTIYTVTAENDRMGMRLQGKPLQVKAKGIVSEAIALGSVQIPADGVPIILLQDRQTLGGYPKIGCVARNDLSLLAQLSAGSKIQFYPLSLTVAQQQYREQLQFFMEFKGKSKC